MSYDNIDGRANFARSSIAQSVERMTVNHDVVGSSPTGGVIRLRGQEVKTSPFHGGNTGSIPVGVIGYLNGFR